MKYYAVKVGINPGIYTSWDECKKNVFGFKGAVYKKFEIKTDAENFINGEKLNENYMNENTKIKDNEGVLYVDGSFRQNDESFSYGYVLITNNGEFEGSKRYIVKELSQFRNVAGEIYGSVSGVKKAMELGLKKVYLHHDYSGLRHWALKEWKANNILTQRYQQFFEKIKPEIDVEFIKVKAHNNIPINEKVDKLAKNADF